MGTTEDVRQYLGDATYPADLLDLISTAQNNGAPPGFVELLGLMPTAVEFHNPEEVADQMDRLKGLG